MHVKMHRKDFIPQIKCGRGSFKAGFAFVFNKVEWNEQAECEEICSLPFFIPERRNGRKTMESDMDEPRAGAGGFWPCFMKRNVLRQIRTHPA